MQHGELSTSANGCLSAPLIPLPSFLHSGASARFHPLFGSSVAVSTWEEMLIYLAGSATFSMTGKT